jgi:hypothetical protein
MEMREAYDKTKPPKVCRIIDDEPTEFQGHPYVESS